MKLDPTGDYIYLHLWPPTISITISEGGCVVMVVMWITMLVVTVAVDGIIISGMIEAAAALVE